jgi:PPK2 family polyphosphate:nucleotide phosphotransferase
MMANIQLKDFPHKAPKDLNKQKIENKTESLARKIGELQHTIYAEAKHSVLIILQGMDASGKDGIIKSVFAHCNPSGIDAYAFKKPTTEEFAHDFLWRCHKLAPRKGNIMIFNRSHYEDILIQKVNGWISDEKRAKRMEAINAFEDLLIFDNNTLVLKFYLHISKERQREKLQERIDDPSKQWKHNDADWLEHEKWDDYMDCYEYAINNSKVPWHIVPCDQRWYRNYFVAQKVLEALTALNPQLPTLAKPAE